MGCGNLFPQAEVSRPNTTTNNDYLDSQNKINSFDSKKFQKMDKSRWEAILMELRNNLEKEFRAFHDMTSQQLDELFRDALNVYEKKSTYTRKQFTSILNKPTRTHVQQAIIANTVVSRIMKFHLKLTQLIAILFFLRDKRLLLQILTGEGKSITIACIAAILALRGHNVDVITSSEVLATRDTEQFKKFYTQFGLEVDHNLHPQQKFGPKNCYKKKTVMYGTAHATETDILNDPFQIHQIRQDRTFDVLIIDEVDSMFIDESGTRTQLTSKYAGYGQFTFLLKMIWSRVNTYAGVLVNLFNKYLLIPHQNQKAVNCISQVEMVSFIEEMHEDLKQQINGQIIDEWRHDFIRTKLKPWIVNAVAAIVEIHQYESYVVINGEIKLVDNENTGVLRQRMIAGNGLHQFLELKHGLQVSTQSLISRFMSNLALYDKYQFLYGLTGTLGSTDSMQFLKELYNVKIMAIPPQRQRRLVNQADVVYKTQQEWSKEILKTATNKVKENRSILVIFQSIWELELIYRSMQADPTFNIDKIITVKLETTQLDRQLQPGHIVLATNLAGRGTDFKLSHPLQESGGLHVIITFLARNTRVERQARGRAGRNGQKGSSQCILCLDKLGAWVDQINMMVLRSNPHYINFDSTLLIEAIKIIQMLNQSLCLGQGRKIASHLRKIDEYYQKYLKLVKAVTEIKIQNYNLLFIQSFSEIWAVFFVKNLQLSKYKPENDNAIKGECEKIFSILEKDPFDVLYPTHLIRILSATVSKNDPHIKIMTQRCLKILSLRKLNLIEKYHLSHLKFFIAYFKQNVKQMLLNVKELRKLAKQKARTSASIKMAQTTLCIEQISYFHQSQGLQKMKIFKQKLSKVSLTLAKQFNETSEIDIGKVRKKLMELNHKYSQEMMLFSQVEMYWTMLEQWLSTTSQIKQPFLVIKFGQIFKNINPNLIKTNFIDYGTTGVLIPRDIQAQLKKVISIPFSLRERVQIYQACCMITRDVISRYGDKFSTLSGSTQIENIIKKNVTYIFQQKAEQFKEIVQDSLKIYFSGFQKSLTKTRLEQKSPYFENLKIETILKDPSSYFKRILHKKQKQKDPPSNWTYDTHQNRIIFAGYCRQFDYEQKQRQMKELLQQIKKEVQDRMGKILIEVAQEEVKKEYDNFIYETKSLVEKYCKGVIINQHLLKEYELENKFFKNNKEQIKILCQSATKPDPKAFQHLFQPLKPLTSKISNLKPHKIGQLEDTLHKMITDTNNFLYHTLHQEPEKMRGFASAHGQNAPYLTLTDYYWGLLQFKYPMQVWIHDWSLCCRVWDVMKIVDTTDTVESAKKKITALAKPMPIPMLNVCERSMKEMGIPYDEKDKVDLIVVIMNQFEQSFQQYIKEMIKRCLQKGKNNGTVHFV